MVSTIFSHCSSSTTARLLPMSRQHGVVYLRRLVVGPLHVGPPSRCSPSTRTLTLHSSTSPSPVLAGTSPLVFPSFLFRFCLVAQKMSKPEKYQNFSYIWKIQKWIFRLRCMKPKDNEIQFKMSETREKSELFLYIYIYIYSLNTERFCPFLFLFFRAFCRICAMNHGSGFWNYCLCQHFCLSVLMNLNTWLECVCWRRN